MRLKLACLAGLLTGIALLLIGGGECPRWLAHIQVFALMLGGLGYGFTVFSPRAPEWLSSRPVVGAALVYMGVICMFLPPQVVASSVLIGSGTRLILTSDVVAVRVVRNTTLVRRTTGSEVTQ